MIELLSGFPDDVVALACHGQVTRRDYEAVLIPAVDRALREHDKLRVYYSVGADFAGIDAGAAWEDFVVGMERLSRWDRIAVVTDVEWIAHAMRLFGFLMPGEARAFPTAEAEAARDWLLAP